MIQPFLLLLTLPLLTSALSIARAPSPNETTASTTCPTDLSAGQFQFPHLIVPTSPQAPDTAFGNSYSATISPANTTLFNFDIPGSYTGLCSLLFLFPFSSDLDPSAGQYTYSGMEQVIYQNGGLDFALLDGVASSATTFATTPRVLTDFGKTQILPGHKYVVANFPCQSGRAITVKASSVNNTSLTYFQDSASEPIGLYIVPCA
ncbi:GPI anchored cell wall protein [Diplocarpon rosae]|nr:GPI anchored cell wall protein [Diplocarpon rosae]